MRFFTRKHRVHPIGSSFKFKPIKVKTKEGYDAELDTELLFSDLEAHGYVTRSPLNLTEQGRRKESFLSARHGPVALRLLKEWRTNASNTAFHIANLMALTAHDTECGGCYFEPPPDENK